MRQDCEASEGVVVAPRSGGGNMGTRTHHECQLSLLVQGRRYVFSHGYKMVVVYAYDCVWLHVGISRQNSFKGRRM